MVCCAGCCFAGGYEFVGEARSRPDQHEPDGGWGYTACCSKPVHFDCLVRHLDPRDKEVDSMSGKVQMELCCPFCRHYLSSSRTRMLSDERRRP